MSLNLSLNLRRGPWGFKGSLRGLEWLKLASKCLTTLNRTASEQQLDKKLWGCLMLATQRFWRRSPCLAWLQCLISSPLGTRALPPILQDTGGDDPYYPPTILLLKLSFVITLFCKFSIKYKVLYIIWVKIDCLRPPTQLNITFMGKSVSTYVVSINIASNGNHLRCNNGGLL